MSRPELRTVRERDLKMSLSELATEWTISPAQLSLIERGQKRQPGWLKYALKGMGMPHRSESFAEPCNSEIPSECPECPECGERMRNRSDHLTHWFHGQLKTHFTCSGRYGRRHAGVSMGIPFGASQLQRLDQAENPHTGIKVQISDRRTKSWYERNNDWVWCDATSGRPDGCGHLCWPAGSYLYSGKKVQIFKCLNKEDTKYYAKRLRHRGGNVFTPKPSRQSNLPGFARHCPHCGGRTVRKGGKEVPPKGSIRVVCKNCGKLSYFSEKSRRVTEGPKRGGPLKNDPHRPTCSICRAPMRLETKYFADFDRLPLPVRKGLGSMPEISDEKAEVVRRYICAQHRSYKFSEIWKRPDGTLVWKRRPGRQLRRGFRLETTSTKTERATREV